MTSERIKKRTNFHDYAWRVLHNNGWQWLNDNQSDYTTFMLTILVTYKVNIYARVSMNNKHLQLDGHYGVLWLDAEYEYNDRPLSYDELDEMLYAIEQAEDNLICISMPFTEDYKFHSNDCRVRNRLASKNKTLRNKLNLEQQEIEDWNKD